MRGKEDKSLKMTVHKVIFKHHCDDIVHSNRQHLHSGCTERGEWYAD